MFILLRSTDICHSFMCISRISFIFGTKKSISISDDVDHNEICGEIHESPIKSLNILSGLCGIKTKYNLLLTLLLR